MINQQSPALPLSYARSFDQPGRAEVARQAGSLRKAVLDSVMHELRTPLTSIKTSVTALLSIPRLKSNERAELLTIIDEETDRLNALVGEVVEQARFDVGERLTLEPCAIEKIIDAAQKRLQHVARRTLDSHSGPFWFTSRSRRPANHQESSGTVARKRVQVFAAGTADHGLCEDERRFCDHQCDRSREWD